MTSASLLPCLYERWTLEPIYCLSSNISEPESTLSLVRRTRPAAANANEPLPRVLAVT